MGSYEAKELRRIAREFGLVDVYAFGSRAQEIASRMAGNPHDSTPSSKSDLDIAVRPKPGKTLSSSERVHIALEHEDLFGVPRVDLVVLPEAEPFLALDIVRGELLHAEDLDAQARYELYFLRRAGDLLPFKKERIRMILEEGARWAQVKFARRLLLNARHG